MRKFCIEDSVLAVSPKPDPCENQFTELAHRIDQSWEVLWKWIGSVECRLQTTTSERLQLKFSDSDLLDVKAASEYTGLSPKTLRNMKCSGDILGQNRNGKRKGKVYFPFSELKRIKGELK